MRKSTKNKIIHGILIIFVIIFAVLASVAAALRDVTVQCMIARSAAAELSKKLNADVRIKTFYIKNDGTICVEHVQINDLYGFPMFKIGTLDAKISPTILSGELKLKHIVFKDVLGNLVKYEGDAKINVTELFAQLKSGKDNDDDSDFNLKVEKMSLDNGHFIFWNQNKDRPEKKGMDYAHLDIDSIYGVFSNLEIRNDSVLGKVHSLRGIDRSGLVLNNAKGDVLFCEKCLNVDSLILCTNESYADLDLRFDYNNSSAYYEFVDSVYITGNIRESTILLSDLKYFAWVLEKMPDKLVFTCDYTGTVSDFRVRDFDMLYGNQTHMFADISLKGLPDFFNTYFDIDIESLETSYDDIVSVAIPSSSITVPLPEMLSKMGIITTSGSFQGLPNDFTTSFRLDTEIGDILADVYLKTNENPAYSFIIATDDLKVDQILKNSGLADVTMNFEMHGTGLEVKDTDFDAVVDFKSFKFKGNEFNDVVINSQFKNRRLDLDYNINHKYLMLDMTAAVDLNSEKPEYFVKADIKDADLVNLHLSDFDTIMLLSSNLDLNFSGDELDNILGYLDIKNTSYNNGAKFKMDEFTANISESRGIKDITIDCDFFNFSGSGIVHFDGIVDVFKNNVIHYFNIPSWRKGLSDDFKNQEFSFNLVLNDTRQLSKLFVPQLYVADGTTVTATYTDLTYYHGSTIESPEIRFNGLIFKNLDVRNTARFREYKSVVMFDDIILRDSTPANPDRIGLENIKFVARCSNDTLKVDMLWDDDDSDDHNKAFIRSIFTRDEENGGVLSIKSDEIKINDSIWNINKDCTLVFNDKSLNINKLMLYTDYQSMSLNGHYPKTDADTLNMVFYNVNVSNFDFITRGYNLDFDGVIDGLVGISGINEDLAFFSNLGVDSFYINKQEVGNVELNTAWNDNLKAIQINTDIYKSQSSGGKVKNVDVDGFYYPNRKKNNLDFELKFSKFKLETLTPFLSFVIRRMNGLASGWIDIKGSVNEPVILGKVMMDNAGCSVNFLNTYYTFTDDIKLINNKILFDNLIMHDTLGKTAVVNGYIGHDHLKDFNFDIDIRCDDFLALNIPEEQAMGFYGTAVTDGTVKIKGPAQNVTMTIDALTRKGTEINIPLSGNMDMDNDFIVFVNKSEEVDTTLVVDIVDEDVKKDRGFNMNLNAEVNPDADLNIFLPMNMGSINARGSGNVAIGLTHNDFTMHGDYLINSGSFLFTLEMVKRTFTLRRGGTLRWTGDPTDADIDVVGVYRTKTSLNSLGADIIDSTAISNNINVDCIIRLSDKLMNPSISFGIELPNATDDVKNTVYSVIDTTNQSVMAQQVFSLMVLGSFAYTGNASISRISTNAGYKVVTQQLSNWLSQISKDFDVGIKYTPNDNLTNEEIEVALSTQLLDERLIIEGNFGVIRGDNVNSNNANNIVGDVDITFRLTKRLSLKAYNHTNIKSNYYLYSFENYSDFTQGVGISFSQSFDNIREIFTLNKKNKAKKPKLKLDDKPKSKK